MRTLTIILSFLFVPIVATAAINTTGYVHDFYTRLCENPDLELPGADGETIPSQKYVYTVLNMMNPRVNPDDIVADKITSTGYLPETTHFLHGAPNCCIDNYFNVERNGCRLCGEWLTTDITDCLTPGVYDNNGTCTPCPDGWICPGGSRNRAPCGVGYWCVNNVRTKCPGGRVQCPHFLQTYAPTMTQCTKNAVLFNPE